MLREGEEKVVPAKEAPSLGEARHRRVGGGRILQKSAFCWNSSHHAVSGNPLLLIQHNWDNAARAKDGGNGVRTAGQMETRRCSEAGASWTGTQKLNPTASLYEQVQSLEAVQLARGHTADRCHRDTPLSGCSGSPCHLVLGGSSASEHPGEHSRQARPRPQQGPVASFDHFPVRTCRFCPCRTPALPAPPHLWETVPSVEEKLGISFKKYFVSTCSVPGSVLGDQSVNEVALVASAGV